MTSLQKLFDEDRSSLPMILRLSAFCAVAFIAFWLTGCATYPKPDPSLIRWDQPYAESAAKAHAESIFGMWMVVAGNSMEPFLYAGDFLTADFTKLYADLKSGALPVYDPNWADASIPFVVHLAIAPEGACWAVKGLNAPNLETGKTAMCQPDYRAQIVAVYTARKKP